VTWASSRTAGVRRRAPFRCRRPDLEQRLADALTARLAGAGMAAPVRYIAWCALLLTSSAEVCVLPAYIWIDAPRQRVPPLMDRAAMNYRVKSFWDCLAA
jgi:hypothetical protein